MKRNASKRDERHGRSRHRPTKVFEFVKLISRPWKSQQRKEMLLGRQRQRRRRTQSNTHRAKRINFSDGSSKMPGHGVQTSRYARRSQQSFDRFGEILKTITFFELQKNVCQNPTHNSPFYMLWIFDLFTTWAIFQRKVSRSEWHLSLWPLVSMNELVTNQQMMQVYIAKWYWSV